MLLRRALLSGKEIPNTVTIPLLGSFTASNGAEPSINTGCTLEADGLYIPRTYVEYKISDLYPKDWSKLALEMDLMYTKTASAHGWFDFFDTRILESFTGVNYNVDPRELFFLFDISTSISLPKNKYIHVVISADFSQGPTCPFGEIIGMSTNRRWPSPVVISKPSALRIGHYKSYSLSDAWQGYVRNVKVTFE